MAELTVHHLENSRSQRILWLLEELELPYALQRYERNRKTMRAPPELLEIHPLGKSPLITLEDGTVLAESGAIIETLVERNGGRLRPEVGSEAHARYLFWLHYAEGSLMPPLLVRIIVNQLRKAPLPFFVRPVVKGIARKIDEAFTEPEIARHVAFIEGSLKDRTWLVSDELTAADIQMSFPLEALVARAGAGASFPRIRALVERMQARPAYERALERGGPYDLTMG